MNKDANISTQSLQGERIKLERQRLGLTQAQVADSLGVAKTTVINWEKEDGTYPHSLHMSKLLDLGFDIHYILTGRYLNSDQPGDEMEEFALIPFYDVKISAGFGALGIGERVEPDSRLAFRYDWLHSRGLNADKLVCVLASGDSMGNTIPDNSTMLVDCSRNNPQDGHIYVIRNSDTLWVKRIQRQIDGTLLLISDNEAYPPMPLRLEEHSDIQIIGQVVYISKDIY